MWEGLGRLIGQWGIPAGLVLGLASVAALAVSRSRWTPDSGAIASGATFTALALGLALGRTRWRGPTALGYGVFMALVWTFERLTRLLPALSIGSTHEALTELNLRAFVGLARLAGWVTALSTGQAITDNGLFESLMALSLWAALGWLGWRLARFGDAISGVIPLVGLMLLNTSLGAAENGVFAATLGLALGLIAHLAYRRTVRGWDDSGVDYPTDIRHEWLFSAICLVGLCLLGIMLAPWVGTVQGWRTLTREVSRWFERPAADTAQQLFSNIQAIDESLAAVQAITPDLTEIGRPIAQGDAVVMWVSTSDPAPLPVEAGRPAEVGFSAYYWRSQVYATYTGRGWEPAPVAAQDAGPPPDLGAPPAGRYWLTQRVDLVADPGERAFAVNMPLAASASIRLIVLAAGDSLVNGPTRTYTVTSAATRVTGETLAGAGLSYPVEVTRHYLQLPSTLPDRVRDLAQRVTAGAATPLAKADAIAAYLRRTYLYDLDAPPAPAGSDSVDAFLFETRAGFCSHFASAMVVLLRAVDVPARVADGYASGSWDAQQRAYRVPVSAAHAWVEVYFPGYGWVEFEPTPAFRERTYALAPETDAAEPEAAPALVVAAPTRAMWGLGLMLVGIGVLAAGAEWQRRRPRTPAEAVRRAYWSMRSGVGLLGWSGDASTTPAEFVATLRPASPALQADLEVLTDLYELTTFAPDPVTTAQGRAASRAAWRSWGEAVRVWLGVHTRAYT